MVFLTADLHLNHENIIKEDFGPHARTQFSSVQEMNDTIISRWNEKVSADDTVYVLGDFALGLPEIGAQLIMSLPGKKILLMGNHDVPKIKDSNGKKKPKPAPITLQNLKYSLDLFEEVYSAYETVKLQHGKYTFVMNHYPPDQESFAQREPHHIFLHAHNHNDKSYNLANMSRHIPVYDVGVDANDFSPISVEELYSRMLEWTKSTTLTCDRCGKPMKMRTGKYGLFFGCTGYPSCDRIYNLFSPRTDR